MPEPRRQRDVAIAAAAALAGVTLALIGVRFWLDPDRARAFFGLRGDGAVTELHKLVALRDLWLGLLAIFFAALREWRSLTVWFALGVGVCLADAGIVAAAGGPARATAFHVASGVFCAGLAVLAWRRFSRAPRD